jgi:hypothetical protein
MRRESNGESNAKKKGSFYKRHINREKKKEKMND